MTIYNVLSERPYYLLWSTEHQGWVMAGQDGHTFHAMLAHQYTAEEAAEAIRDKTDEYTGIGIPPYMAVPSELVIIALPSGHPWAFDKRPCDAPQDEPADGE